MRQQVVFELTELGVMLPLQARTHQLWSEHNPDLDTSAMEVVALVKRITVALDRAVGALYDNAALTPAEVGLLVPLRHLEAPVTAARLAAHLGISRAGVSKKLARLEQRGFITRSTNPADRRSAPICVTDAGKDTIDELFPQELTAHATLLVGLGQNRQHVVDVLIQLAETMESRLNAADTGSVRTSA